MQSAIACARSSLSRDEVSVNAAGGVEGAVCDRDTDILVVETVDKDGVAELSAISRPANQTLCPLCA